MPVVLRRYLAKGLSPEEVAALSPGYYRLMLTSLKKPVCSICPKRPRTLPGPYVNSGYRIDLNEY
jgi:hypothetical protein